MIPEVFAVPDHQTHLYSGVVACTSCHTSFSIRGPDPLELSGPCPKCGLTYSEFIQEQGT